MSPPLRSIARDAFPDDTVRIMKGNHIDTAGNSWPSGTEYTPFSCGVDNTVPNSPTVQIVQIDGVTVRFAG